MIQKLDLGDEKVMAWRMEGKMDQAQLGPVMQAFNNKLDTTDKLNLYLEVPKVSGITLPAIWETLKSEIRELRKYNDRIEKVAVVTDKEWIQTLTGAENRLFPGVDERPFSMEEAEAAKLWITT